MKIRIPGKFGHTFANSENPDETAPSGFSLFALLISYSNNNIDQTRSLSEFTCCPKLPDFTLNEFTHVRLCQALIAFCKELIKAMMQEHKCKILIIIWHTFSLKLYFWRGNVKKICHIRNIAIVVIS